MIILEAKQSLWEKTKNFISNNKGKLALGLGAAALAGGGYYGYKQGAFDGIIGKNGDNTPNNNQPDQTHAAAQHQTPINPAQNANVDIFNQSKYQENLNKVLYGNAAGQQPAAEAAHPAAAQHAAAQHAAAAQQTPVHLTPSTHIPAMSPEAITTMHPEFKGTVDSAIANIAHNNPMSGTRAPAMSSDVFTTMHPEFKNAVDSAIANTTHEINNPMTAAVAQPAAAHPAAAHPAQQFVPPKPQPNPLSKFEQEIAKYNPNKNSVPGYKNPLENNIEDYFKTPKFK